MKLNLTDYLYHGLLYSSKETLEKIFNSGYLMTRNSLEKYLGEFEYKAFLKTHSPNWNGLDAVSLSCHPEDKELIEKYNLKPDNYDNAYESYIIGNICLFIDKQILERFQVKQDSCIMNYELQITSDIPVCYIKAIGVQFSNNPYSSQNMINMQKYLKALLLGDENLINKYGKCSNLSTILEDLFYNSLYNIEERSIKPIYEIKQLIEKYGLDIPIVDTTYGFEIPSEEKQHKRLVKIYNQCNQYRKKLGK